MQPLLELICEYTGYSCLTLIGGTFDERDKLYKVGAVHHGEIKDVIVVPSPPLVDGGPPLVVPSAGPFMPPQGNLPSRYFWRMLLVL